MSRVPRFAQRSLQVILKVMVCSQLLVLFQLIQSVSAFVLQMGGVCITETIPKQPLIRSLGESASRGTAQAKAVAKSIHDLLIIGQTAGKETNNHSEINGSNYNRLQNPIGKAGRPWRHGYCRRVPFAVAQSRIQN